MSTTLLHNQPCPHCGRYDNRGISIDALIIKDEQILLIKRGVEPDKGKWATPGGYIGWDESAEEAVIREVKEETGLTVTKVTFFNVYTLPNRHPKQVITLAYIVEVENMIAKNGDDADEVEWFALNNLPTPLAFDHEKNIKEVITTVLRKQT
ncbi:MAG: NUDIX hydrolase [Candidatus Roizmanbacteria bacterium]|nr:NUDIX hydrolase [Candidatus Roizmanbacteria bacterium]